MSDNNINSLLTKYWDAQTSIEEENQLKDYFNSSDVSDEHTEFAPLFQIFKLESDTDMPDIKLSFPTETVKNAKVFQLSKSWKAIAAVFVIALSSIFLFKNDLNTIESSKKATIVNIDDPEEALEYTKMALAMVSKNYRKGSAKLSGSMDNVNKLNIIK